MADGSWTFDPSEIRFSRAGAIVGTADPDTVDADKVMVVGRRRIRDVAKLELFNPGVNKCLHLAVNPPSTINTCPVT